MMKGIDLDSDLHHQLQQPPAFPQKTPGNVNSPMVLNHAVVAGDHGTG